MAIQVSVPPTLWLRLGLLFYRTMWVIRPLLRRMGMEPRMSWAEVIFATKLLLPSIASYGPEVVVGVGIGGAIWGAVLAGSLHDIPLVVLDRRVRYTAGERHVELIGSEGINANAALIRRKKVLLVNAEVLSGRTTLRVKELLRELEPTEIKLACLDLNTFAQVRPDYSYASHNGVIQKPWRRVPTYTNPDEPVRQ